MTQSYTQILIHKLLTEPDAWKVDDFWAIHQSGLTIWIGSGAFSCRIEKPEYREFPFFERLRVYKTIQQLRQKKS